MWLVDGLVDGDDDDAGVGRLLERGADAGRVGRVDDDRVDAGGDEVAEVLELAAASVFAMRDVERGDLAGGERLRLDRADHLLAPAVALHGVGDADRIVGGQGRQDAPARMAAPVISGSSFVLVMAVHLPWFGRSRPVAPWRPTGIPDPPHAAFGGLSRGGERWSLHVGPEDVAGEEEAALYRLVRPFEAAVLMLDDHRPS